MVLFKTRVLISFQCSYCKTPFEGLEAAVDHEDDVHGVKCTRKRFETVATDVDQTTSMLGTESIAELERYVEKLPQSIEENDSANELVRLRSQNPHFFHFSCSGQACWLLENTTINRITAPMTIALNQPL